MWPFNSTLMNAQIIAKIFLNCKITSLELIGHVKRYDIEEELVVAYS